MEEQDDNEEDKVEVVVFKMGDKAEEEENEDVDWDDKGNEVSGRCKYSHEKHSSIGISPDRQHGVYVTNLTGGDKPCLLFDHGNIKFYMTVISNWWNLFNRTWLARYPCDCF